MDPELKLWTQYPDLFWVATTENGKVVGSIGSKHIDSTTTDMHKLCVDAEFQKLGIGQKLIETLLESARENGYSTITCYTSIANIGSLKLFRKNDFQKVRETNVQFHHSWFTYLSGIKAIEYRFDIKNKI